MTNLDSILKSGDITLPTKVPLVKAMVFPVVIYWMWELDYKESWVLKNWCFQTVVLEKTLESPLDCKELQPVYSKGDQSWVFFGRNDAKAETPILWLPRMRKVDLKLNIQKMKIMPSGPMYFMANKWGNSGSSVRFIFGGCKSTADGDCSHEIKRHLLLGRKVMTN